MISLNTLIEKLSQNIADAEKFLYDLGVRHIKYGSKEEHLPVSFKTDFKLTLEY